MAAVYMLYSKVLDKYYIGSCLELDRRLANHKNKTYENGYTTRADDWELFCVIENLEYNQARGIEAHIKRMKSRKYLSDLKKYNSIVIGLRNKYK